MTAGRTGAHGGAAASVDPDTCPRCGHPLPTGANFCPNCGAPVGVPAASERRVVTVVFADSGRLHRAHE